MKSLKKGTLFVVLVAAATSLQAQPAQVPADPAAPGVSAGVKVTLSPQEMATSAIELEGQVRVHLQQVQNLQHQARKEKDVIKLSCINDKMVKLKAEANIFDTAKTELTAQLNTDARGAAYQKLTSSAAEVQKTREEAERCAGEPELAAGESANSWTTPEIPDDPTSGLPFDDVDVVIEPPALASPYY